MLPLPYLEFILKKSFRKPVRLGSPVRFINPTLIFLTTRLLDVIEKSLGRDGILMSWPGLMAAPGRECFFPALRQIDTNPVGSKEEVPSQFPEASPAGYFC